MEKHLQGLVSDVENMLDKVDATAGAKYVSSLWQLKSLLLQ